MKNFLFQSFYLDSPIIKGRCFDVFVPENITGGNSAMFELRGSLFPKDGKDYPDDCPSPFVNILPNR